MLDQDSERYTAPYYDTSERTRPEDASLPYDGRGCPFPPDQPRNGHVAAFGEDANRCESPNSTEVSLLKSVASLPLLRVSHSVGALGPHRLR